MTFDGIDAAWWPFVFIIIAGWLTTDTWRFLGVYLGGYLREDSEVLVLVRAIATSLVAAVIANFIFFPAGTLATVPLAVRLFALGIGFAVYLIARKNTLLGIICAEAVLAIGMFVSGS